VAAAIFWFGLGMHRGLLLSGDIRSKVWPWAPFVPKSEPVAPALSDPVWHFVPWFEFARRELAAGRPPLWNPHQDGGVPLLGNGQTGIGSPLNWPVLLFGVAAGWNASLLLCFLLALTGTYFWLRDLERSAVAAALGAVAFAMSGSQIAWLEIIAPTAAPVPLLLLFARRVARAPTRGSFVGLAIATYLVLSGGHPETQLMAALLAAAVTLRWAAGRPADIGLPVAGALFGAGLAAPFLIPFAEYFRLSEARLGIDRHPFVLPLKDLGRLVGRSVAGSNVIEAAAAVSVTVLMLAVAGLWLARRDREVLFCAGLAAVMLLITYDNPCARFLSRHTPVYWTRALLFLPLPLGYLAARGLDELRGKVRDAGRPALSAAVGAAALVLVFGELLLAAQGVHGHLRPSDLTPSTPLLDALRSDHEIFRVLPMHTFLPPNTATDYGLDDVRGYDSLAPLGWRRRREAMGRFSNAPTQLDVLEPWDLAPGGRALDFWNVKYLLLHPQFAFGTDVFRTRKGLDLDLIYSGPDGKILRNKRVQPRARLSVPGFVTIRQRQPTRWDIEIDSSRPGFFLLADPFFPGWCGSIDGKEVALRLAPGDPIAFPVPAGRHAVRIDYRSQSLRWGMAALVTSALVLLALLLQWRPR
jgi:hypothetical protein